MNINSIFIQNCIKDRTCTWVIHKTYFVLNVYNIETKKHNNWISVKALFDHNFCHTHSNIYTDGKNLFILGVYIKPIIDISITLIHGKEK